MAWNDRLYNSTMAVAGRAKLAQDQETRRRQQEFEENIMPQLAADGLSQAAAMAMGDYFVKNGRLPNDASKDIPNWKELAQTPDEVEEVAPVQTPTVAKTPPAKEESGILGSVWDTLVGGAESLIARADAARHGTAAAEAFAESDLATAARDKAPILARLEQLRTGRATRTVLLPGGDYAEVGMAPEATEVPMSAREIAAETTLLTKRLNEITKNEASGVYAAEQQRLKTESQDRRRAAEVATGVAKDVEANLPSGVARVTRVVGSNLTGEQALSTLAPLATAVITRSPAATTAATVLANIPQAQASFNNSYDIARNKYGATIEEAQAYAAAVTAIEFGSETVGGALGAGATAGLSMLQSLGGKASKKALTETLEKTIASRTRRFVTGQVLDAAGEASSALGQRLLDTSLEGTGFGTEAGQKALAQANEDFSYTESLIDAAIGSVGVGGVPGAIAAQTTYSADRRAQSDRTLADTLAGESAEASKTSAAYQAERERVVAEAKKQDDIDAAYAQRYGNEAPISEQEKADQMEAGFQTMERDREAPTSRVERYADVVERVPVYPAAEITPEQVVAQREQAEADRIKAEELKVQQQRQRDEAEASARLDKARKQIESNKKKAEAAAKGNETKRRDALATQVATEHADKTPKEQAQILADLIAQPEAKAVTAKDKPKSVEEKVQGVINQVEGLRKQKATQRVNNRIRSLYRANPELTAKEIAAKLDAEEGVDVVDTDAPSQDELKAKIDSLNKSTGSLNMDQSLDAAGTREQEAASLSQNGPVVPRTAEKQKKHVDNLKKLFSSLGNTQENVDIRNLIKQGKIVLTDRPESVGRETTAAPGQYSPADGKTYIYLDNFDVSKPREAMLQAVAAHESGHMGQFNQRDGRSNLFKNLLGDKGNAAANKTIRDAAARGNALAKDAVERAINAAKQNKSFTNVEDLELVPYLFSEAKIGKNPPGTVGKVIRDVKNAARAATRKVFNKELEFSIDELAAAGNAVAGEIVKTDVSPDATQTGSADMIYPVGTKEGDREANLSRLYKSVDGREKYVLTDEGAKLKGGSVFRLLDSPNSGEQMKVDDLLVHDILYDMVPEARNIPVVLDSSISGFAAYDPNPDAKYISVHPRLLQGQTRTQVKEALLHEIQHYVQDHTGGEGQFFDERDIPGIEEYNREVAAAAKVRTVASNAVLGNVAALTKNAPMSVKQRIPGIVANYRIKDDASKVVQLRQLLQMNGIHQEGEGARLLAKWEAANKEYHEIEAERRGVVNEHYMANINEREAFRTQLDASKSQAELDARGNPEPAMRTQGEELDFGQRGDGRIDVPEGNGRVVARGSLDMASPKEETKAANPKFSVKERINRILSHGRQERLDTVKIAEDLHTQMVDAIHRDTGGKVLLGANIGPTNMSDAMNKDFMEFLAHPDQGTVEGRARIISEMKAKYPETTKVLVEARDRISDMTMDTINDMLSTGRPLSITQRKNIATMLANKDTYMSRAYAAFQAGRGRKWADTRWNNFAKNIGKDVEQIVSPKVKADVKAVRDAITVITNGLRIPDTDTLQDMTMEQLVSIADRHGIKESQLQYDRTDPDASWLKRDELISELEKVKATYSDGMLEQIAMGDAKNLLGLGDKESNYAKQMSALARNPGTLKERQRVPLEIRRLLGEIELAPGAFMATMSNQAALRARAKVVSELINDPQGDIAITRDKYLNLPEKEQKKYTEVRSEEWGALNGMYLRDYAYTRMEEVTGLMYSWRDAAKRMSHDVSPLTGKLVQAGTGTLGALNRWTKLMAVVYNPMSWIGNFGGSFLNMVGAGNFSPAALWEGMGTAREYVGGTFNTTTTPRLSKVIRYMNLEAADIAELQNVLGNTLEKYFDNPSAFKDSVAKLDKHGHGLLGRGHKSVIAGYAIADNWSKIANFYHRYGVLKNMYDAAGIKKTEDQILQEAGDDTSYTNISPERVHSIIRTAESAGLSQYAPYFAEVLRTRATNMALAYRDIMRGQQLRKDGHTKAANIIQTHAAMRLAGQLVVNAALPAVGAFKIASHLAAVGVPTALAYSIANSLSALGGDDEDNELKRSLLSEPNRIQDMMMVGKNKNGYPMYFPFSQKLDPNGPFTDLVRAFVYAETPEQLYNNLKASSLYIFPQVLVDSYKAVTADKFAESDMTRLFPQLTQTMVDAGISANDVDRFMNVADNFIPGLLRAQKTQNTTDGVDADPATKKSLERLSTLLGVRFETFDPRRTLKGYADESNERKATNSAALNRSLMNVPTLTDKALMDATEKFFREELARQKNDYLKVRGLRACKFNDEQIGELLAQGGYPKKSIPDLVEGNAVVALKLKSLIEYAESSGSYQDTREYEKRKEKVAQVVQKILEKEEELNELGITVDKSQMPKGWNE